MSTILYVSIGSVIANGWRGDGMWQDVEYPAIPSSTPEIYVDHTDDGDIFKAELEEIDPDQTITNIKLRIYSWCDADAADLDLKFDGATYVLSKNLGSLTGNPAQWGSYEWHENIPATSWNNGELWLTAETGTPTIEIYALYFELTVEDNDYIDTDPIPLEANSGARMSMIMFEEGTGGVVCGGRASTNYDEIATGGVVVGGRAEWNEPTGVRCGGTAEVWGITNEHANGGVVVSGGVFFTYDEVSSGGVVVGGKAKKILSYNTTAGAALRFHLTGEDNTDPDLSIGGDLSETIASRVGVKYQTAIAGIQILDCSHDLGSSVIQSADVDSLSLGAGDSVSTPVGWISQLEDGTKWISVKRTSSANLSGETNMVLVDQFNNVFGGSNWEDGSGDLLRAVIMVNDSAEDISNLKLWVTPLSTTKTCVTGLGASGTGTITATAGDFISWDWKGTCRIESSGGTLKEIVHYYRTDSDTLHVVGREACGTTATAGTAGDKLTQVSPIMIGTEATVSDAISLDASGVTFETGISSATGISVGDLIEADSLGLWIQRDLETAGAYPEYQVSISYTYDWQGTTYTGVVKGLCRNADTSIEGYELHIGVDEAPDLTGAPDYTSGTLPIETSALAVSHDYYCVTNYRNKWDMVSENIDSTVISIDGDGEEQALPPTAPVVDKWLATGSTFTLFGHYEYLNDSAESLADSWKIYVSYDGSDPLLQTPTTVAFTSGFDGSFPLGILPITWVSSSQSVPTTAKIVLRVANGSVESTNTDVHTATSTDAEFVGNHLAAFFGSLAEAL